MINIFFIILIIFIIFVILQVYYYLQKYNKNKKLIVKMENFESKLNKIDSNNKYLLDDSSLQNLLEDYNKLKNNT